MDGYINVSHSGNTVLLQEATSSAPSLSKLMLIHVSRILAAPLCKIEKKLHVFAIY